VRGGCVPPRTRESWQTTGILRRDEVVELLFVHPLHGGVPTHSDRHEHHERRQPIVAEKCAVCGCDPDQEFQGQQDRCGAEAPRRDVHGRRSEAGADLAENDEQDDRRSDERPADGVAHHEIIVIFRGQVASQWD
jgi:hypothetical protein